MQYTSRFLLRTSPIYHIPERLRELFEIFPSYGSIYADDTNLTIASDDIEKLDYEARQELLNLSEWMRINKLSPNPAKTEYMIIGHSRKVNTLNISNEYLGQSSKNEA